MLYRIFRIRDLRMRRLEAAYLQEDRREYEITRHVSLVLHDPSQLIRLKETGECEIELPETVNSSKARMPPPAAAVLPRTELAVIAVGPSEEMPFSRT